MRQKAETSQEVHSRRGERQTKQQIKWKTARKVLKWTENTTMCGDYKSPLRGWQESGNRNDQRHQSHKDLGNKSVRQKEQQSRHMHVLAEAVITIRIINYSKINRCFYTSNICSGFFINKFSSCQALLNRQPVTWLLLRPWVKPFEQIPSFLLVLQTLHSDISYLCSCYPCF